jgi:hypothetical protein
MNLIFLNPTIVLSISSFLCPGIPIFLSYLRDVEEAEDEVVTISAETKSDYSNFLLDSPLQ